MKILIIEDEKSLISAIQERLVGANFGVDYLMDGESGQKRIELHSNDYDLVLLDLGLPKRDGLTLLRNIRKQGIIIPVLILTGKDSVDKIVEGLNSGADDYMVKPFSYEELIARINALLRRPQQIIPNNIQIKGIVLDRANQKITQDGKEIPLTLKEFRLLEYLMRRPDQIISREDIFSNIWDFASESFSNVVDAQIKNIRKKMNPNIIETIRGTGYKIGN